MTDRGRNGRQFRRLVPSMRTNPEEVPPEGARKGREARRTMFAIYNRKEGIDYA